MTTRLEGLTLLDNKAGSNTKRVRMYLAEKGLEIQRENVAFSKMEHRTPEFRRINPMAALPVLRLEDGTYLSESYAICRYLEELHPNPPLFGTTPKERAIIEMWNRRIELDVASYVTSFVKHSQPFFAEVLTQVPDYVEACRKDALKKFDWLEGEMAGRDYIAGNAFTVVDITTYARLGTGKGEGLFFTERHPNLLRWWERIESRPSAQA
ncbi:glutathione S-transferase family protein [Emcibacter sp. SYSU 3D8]|uniref:glutathione S-transferase family protein n=1 Tax=Emcibacter sp. SYSU 3D8 TaxID=3133969 RepID=UPI0031FE4459